MVSYLKVISRLILSLVQSRFTADRHCSRTSSIFPSQALFQKKTRFFLLLFLLLLPVQCVDKTNFPEDRKTIVPCKYLPLSHAKPQESFLRLCMGQREVLAVHEFAVLSSQARTKQNARITWVILLYGGECFTGN